MRRWPIEELLLLAVALATAGWVLRSEATYRAPAPQAAVAGAPIDDPTERRSGSNEAPDSLDRNAVLELEQFAFPDYDPPELRAEAAPLTAEAFPPRVRPLHGAEIRVRGFPLALDATQAGARAFLLTRFPPGCCFGSVPVWDEWIGVELASDLEDSLSPSEPVTLSGVLDVGERLDEEGFVTSLYRLRQARLDGSD